MKLPLARVIVMSKAPVPGQVKTRLAPLLGMDGGASCYREMLEDTLDKLQDLSSCDVELCCAPNAGHEFFTACQARFGVSLASQDGTDLGERMSHAIERALQQVDRVVLIGADCPDLETGDIETAFQRLEAGADVVIGPAHDGGYYLIGMQAHLAGLFDDIAWGSGQVMAQTRRNISRQGLNAHLLSTRADIDTPADYLAWQQARR